MHLAFFYPLAFSFFKIIAIIIAAVSSSSRIARLVEIESKEFK